METEEGQELFLDIWCSFSSVEIPCMNLFSEQVVYCCLTYHVLTVPDCRIADSSLMLTSTLPSCTEAKDFLSCFSVRNLDLLL